MFHHVLLFLIGAASILCGSSGTSSGTKNILAVTTLASPSHHVFHDVYLLELANRGYNVTILGHDEDKHHHPNYTHITMEGVYKKLSADIDLIGAVEFSHWQFIMELCWNWTEATFQLDTQTEGLKNLTNYPDDFKFDLIIWDIKNAPALFPLVEKFGRPPVIAVNPFVNSPNVFRNVFQSYIPFFLNEYTDHMTYWERINSNFWTIVMELTREWYFMPRQKSLARAYFGNVELSMEDFERNISLLLTNHHPVLNYVEALPPNVIPVGGLQVNRTQEIPNNMTRILDSAKSGTILFSLGSNIKPKNLGDEKIRTILEAFSKLEQTVIWKFDHTFDHLDNLPKNVHVQKWVPQSAILAHPNTVLFITHGGLLSSHEIFYHGVPVVGIPFFLDQIQNVGIFVAKGIGAKLAFSDIKGDNFFKVIAKVLNDPSYRDNAKKLSKLYRDRQNEPLETAIYWIEYVLRHGTAGHLDLATRDMTFFQLYNLDLFLIALAPILLCIVLIRLFCKRSVDKPRTKLKAL